MIPNECVSPDSTVCMPTVRALVDLAERAGAPRALVLSDAALDPQLICRPDARVTRADMYRLCGAMLDRTGRADLGAYCAEHLLPQAFTPLAELSYHSATLRESMQSLLLTDDVSWQMTELGHSVIIRSAVMAGASLEVERFISEIAFTSLYRRIRAYRPHAQFDRIAFAYPAPSYRQSYERLFQAQPSFGEPFTGLEFPRSWMDARSPVANVDQRLTVRALSERKLQALTRRRSLVARVRAVLLKQPSRKVEMQAVARELGSSERTLRRHLLAEGTTFALILDDVLAHAAISCLLERQRSIQETACELGFGDRTSFHRAFRRWTGSTPSALQRANKPKAKARRLAALG